jgi:capsular polysaccharide biosynthesis protein
MELRRYAGIVRRHWIIAAMALIAATVATLMLILPRPLVYETTGTMLVRPIISGSADQTVNATDVLIRGVQIPATYATIARSDLISSRAEELLPPGIDRSDLSVGAEVLTDTNVLKISVRGHDPVVVRSMANAVMTELVRYAGETDEAYTAERLDAPNLPSSPVGPSKRMVIALGVFIGALLGIALALFAEYIRRPTDSASGVITDAQTGLHNEQFLRQRLREEMSRARRSSQGFAFGVLKVAVRVGENGELTYVPMSRDLRRVAQHLRLTVPEEAVVAYLGGGTFAGMFPEMPRSEVEGVLVGWSAAVGSLLDGHARSGAGPQVDVTRSVCQFSEATFVGSSEAKKIARGLTVVGSEDPGDPGQSETPVKAKASKAKSPNTKAPKAKAPKANAPSEPPVRDRTPADGQVRQAVPSRVNREVSLRTEVPVRATPPVQAPPPVRPAPPVQPASVRPAPPVQPASVRPAPPVQAARPAVSRNEEVGPPLDRPDEPGDPQRRPPTGNGKSRASNREG